MKIIFFSAMFSDVETDIKRSTNPNSVSGHKFQENLLKGIEDNDCDLYVINVPRIRSYPDYPQIVFHTKQRIWGSHSSGVDIGFINLPVLNYMSQIVTGYCALNRVLKKDKHEDYILLTFNSNLHTCFTMLLARILHKNILLCNVIGDLHGQYGITNRTPGLKGTLIRWIEGFQDSIGRKFDSFVFLTKYMAQAMGVDHKPNTVMECLYALNQEKLKPVHNEDTEKKTIFYAGSLCKEYGIEHLLRAFSRIQDTNFSLQIAGQGDGVELVRQYENQDERIKYLGVISPNEVEKCQQEATVLVNPRTSEHEFVKYSFASKTVECLSTGKPYVAHRLPCDPPEYADYIQYATEETDQALAEKLVEVCALSSKQRDALGIKCREYVLNKKNPKVMCRRVIDMWQEQLR